MAGTVACSDTGSKVICHPAAGEHTLAPPVRASDAEQPVPVGIAGRPEHVWFTLAARRSTRLFSILETTSTRGQRF